MKLTVPKVNAPKLSRCLQRNEMIEVLACRVKDHKVTYEVDAPEYFEFPNWVTVEA